MILLSEQLAQKAADADHGAGSEHGRGRANAYHDAMVGVRQLEAELAAERVAHARTQGHLDDFQGAVSDGTLKILELAQQIEDLESQLRVARQHLDAQAANVTRLEGEKIDAIGAKDGAYSERNRLVAFLTRLFPSVLSVTEIEGWDPEWHHCVFLETPAGQLSWHVHDSEVPLFEHLPFRSPGEVHWDGHTTEQKYRRLVQLATADCVHRAYVQLKP